MASIKNTTTYTTSGYNQNHTISGFNCSGTDTLLAVFGFNKNPASEVDGITANSNSMTLEESSINADVCAVQGYSHKINNSSFDIVCSTPSYKQQTMIATALQNVDQTTPVAGTKGAGGWGTSATTTYTGTAGNLLLVSVTTQNSRTLTASNVTEEENFLADGDIGQCFLGYVEATGSEQTIGATLNSGNNWEILILEITATVGNTVTHTVGTVLTDTYTQEHTVDTNITDSDSTSHTVDTRITGQQTQNHTVDTVVVGESGGITYEPADDFQSRASVHLAKFRTWLGDELGFVGEIGTYSEATGEEQDKWTALMAWMLLRCKADNIGWQFWATGHHWNSDYETLFYDKVGGNWTTTAVSSAPEGRYADTLLTTGGSYAGLEFGTRDNHSWTSAPSASDIQYHYNRGIRTLRIPIRWEYLQPTRNSALDATELGKFVDTLNACQNAGMEVLIDIHNYARYDTGSGYVNLDATGVLDDYLDFLDRLMGASVTDDNDETVLIKNHSAVWGIGIMNEPAYVSTSDWEELSQSIYDHLRSATEINYSGHIAVAIGNWSGIHSIDTYHPDGPWITPASGDTNYSYEGHYYPNNYGVYGNWDGTFSGTYDEENTSASSFSGQGSFTITEHSTTEHTVDTILKTNETLGTDLWRLMETVTEHTVDTALKTTEETKHTVDTLTQTTEGVEHTIDTLLTGDEVSTHSVDTLLAGTEEIVHGVDTSLVKDETETHTVDTILKEVKTETHTVDTALGKTSLREHTVDAFVSTGNMVFHSIDTILLKREDAEHTVDTSIFTVGVETHTIDTSLLERGTDQHTVDTILYKEETTEHTVDTYLKEVKTTEHTVDTILKADSVVKTHTVDTTTKKAFSGSHTVDTNIKGWAYTGKNTTDDWTYKDKNETTTWTYTDKHVV